MMDDERGKLIASADDIAETSVPFRDPDSTSSTTSNYDSWETKSETFKANAKAFSLSILGQEFDDVYADSVTKFTEVFSDAIFFYNFGYSKEEMYTTTSGGAHPFYPSSIHVTRGKVLVEDITELVERILGMIDNTHCCPLTEAEKSFPLVLPVSISRASFDWPTTLLANPVVAEAFQLQQAIAQHRNTDTGTGMGICIRESRDAPPPLIQIDNLLSMTPHLAVVDLLHDGSINTSPETESLIYLALMAGCVSLYRNAYERLRIEFREYIRTILIKLIISVDNITITKQSILMRASDVQKVLDVSVFGFGAIGSIRSAFESQIVALAKRIQPKMSLTASAIKVLNDLTFFVLQRLLCNSHSDSNTTSTSTIYEFDATNSLDCAFTPSTTEDRLYAWIAAQDEEECIVMQTLAYNRILKYDDCVIRNAMSIVDESAVNNAIDDTIGRELISYIRREIDIAIAAFESAAAREKSISAILPALVFVPEYLAIIAVECHQTVLTAKAAIIIAAAMQFIVVKCIELATRISVEEISTFICPHDICCGIANNNGLLSIFEDCVIREGGAYLYESISDPTKGYPEQPLPYLDSVGRCLYTGFIYGLGRTGYDCNLEEESKSHMTRQERKVAAFHHIDTDVREEAMASMPFDTCDLSSEDFSIDEYNNSVSWCRHSIRRNNLLCIDRACIEHLIDEYVTENDLTKYDVQFSHEALNLLQTACEAHLLSLLQLSKQRCDDGLVSAKDIDASVADLSLWQACRNGDIVTAQEQILLGANVNCQYRKYTPLMHAARIGNLELVQLLVEGGADIDKIGRSTALLEAVYRKEIDIVQYLLSKQAAIIKPNPAIECCQSNTEAVKARYQLQLAWFAAISSDDTALVELFIEHGVNINMKLNGRTALHVVCTLHTLNMDIAELLIYRGIDTTLTSVTNKTAFDFLMTKNDKERYLAAIETRDNPGLK